MPLSRSHKSDVYDKPQSVYTRPKLPHEERSPPWSVKPELDSQVDHCHYILWYFQNQPRSFTLRITESMLNNLKKFAEDDFINYCLQAIAEKIAHK
ncbi:MAG: hypothetical protein PUP91_21540 [Rhizonema sp. PD37]|nr:hypothetical protein [Rhizonema sp. PD37]